MINSSITSPIPPGIEFHQYSVVSIFIRTEFRLDGNAAAIKYFERVPVHKIIHSLHRDAIGNIDPMGWSMSTESCDP